MNLLQYSSILFDCDGVILNSNKIKSASFYHTAAKYCEDSAKELLDYHRKNGGVSRYIKFQYFLDRILPKYCVNNIKKPSLSKLLLEYKIRVEREILKCTIAEGLSTLREKTKNSDWLVITGGDQEEVRTIFKKRNIYGYFNKGIYGSPKSKEDILTNLFEMKKITQPSVFLGDSIYDYKVAKKFNLDFIFISEWTEVERWEEFVESNTLSHTSCIQNLIY